MTVFKGYLKVIKAMAPMILVYTVIFFGITIAMQRAMVQTETSTYQAEGLKIGIVDQEKSGLSQALADYLDRFHQIIPLENDKKVLQEKLFYRDVDYIVNISSDFTEQCIKGDGKISVTKVPGSYEGYYVDQQLNSFLNNAKVYEAAGLSGAEIADAIASEKEAEVTMINTEANGGTVPAYNYYFRYIPYLFISLFGYAIGNVLIIMKKKDLQRRMHASAISTQRQSLEGILAISSMGLLVWVFTIVASIGLFGGALLSSGKMGYFLLNTLMMLFVSIGIAYMIGSLIDNFNALNGLVNVLGLGMSFLCGVFVEMSLLSSGVRRVAHFLPVYWYENINELLGQYNVISPELQQTIWKSMGIQLVFAIAMFCVGMVANRMRRQEE